jgi:translation initiation factor eIF-2B subunit delta
VKFRDSLKSKGLNSTYFYLDNSSLISYFTFTMTSATPSTTPGPSAAGASPSIAQTTPTSASNNGESSQPKPKPTNPPQSAKPNKGKEAKEEGGGKGKTAKELKKEKRAALVAARGGGEEGDAPGSSTPSPASRPDKVSIDGTPQPQNQSNSTQRPTFPSHDSILPPAPRTEGFYSHVVTHKHPDTREAFNSGRIHPLVVRLGVLMANGELRGANARTMGMMSAFKEVIRDYETPESVVMWKDLMSHLSPMISFLEGCRPKGTGGGNAIR